MSESSEPIPVAADTPSKAEAIARIKEMKDEIARQVAKTGPSGAVPNAPSHITLDASVVQDAKPDVRLRWVHTKKAARRQVEGYVRVPEVEGGRQVGDLILMALDRKTYDERVAAQRKMNNDRLDAHNKEMESAAESIAKHLRDTRGVNVRAEDILVRG